MAENRKILNLPSPTNRQPPPTKLLITHGKRNFTIKRTPTQKTPTCDNYDLGKFMEDINKVRGTLKKRNDRPSTLDIDENEMEKKHKEILKTPAKDQNGFTNGNHEPTLERSLSFNSKQGQFANITKRRVYAGAMTVDVDTTDSVVSPPPPPPPVTNGMQKPFLPEKPEHLKSKIPPPPPPTKQLDIPPVKSRVESFALSPNSNGVNYQQKTVVSFSRDLANGPNKYPDTVKVSTNNEINDIDPKERQFVEGFSKLKFDIAADGDIVVPMIKNPS